MKKTFFYPFFIFSVVQLQAQRDSLDIKIGQMILIGLPKAEVDSSVLEEVKQGRVGSLIYFEKMDNTQLGSADVAIDKARTAARTTMAISSTAASLPAHRWVTSSAPTCA